MIGLPWLLSVTRFVGFITEPPFHPSPLSSSSSTCGNGMTVHSVAYFIFEMLVSTHCKCWVIIINANKIIIVAEEEKEREESLLCVNIYSESFHLVFNFILKITPIKEPYFTME